MSNLDLGESFVSPMAAMSMLVLRNGASSAFFFSNGVGVPGYNT